MTSQVKFRTSEESNEIYIFGKHMTRAIQKIQFLSILDKYFKSDGNINAI